MARDKARGVGAATFFLALALMFDVALAIDLIKDAGSTSS
jgi:hypothetical protein